MKLIKELLMSSNYWVLNKTIVKEFGIETAFLLSNFAEAEKMMKDKNGWFYQTADTVESMTGLNRYKQDKAIDQLLEIFVLEKDVRGMPAKRYFKINYEVMSKLVCKPSTNKNVSVEQTSMQEDDKLVCKPSTTNKESTNKQSNKKSTINVSTISDVGNVKEHYDSKENLPGYRSITQARTKHINARLKDYSLETVKEVLDMADESTFLTDNLTAEDGKWYNFDWIFNPNNFIKILEGNYSWSNKKQSKVNYKDVYDDIPEGF